MSLDPITDPIEDYTRKTQRYVFFQNVAFKCIRENNVGDLYFDTAAAWHLAETILEETNRFSKHKSGE